MLQKGLRCPLDKRTGELRPTGWPCDRMNATLRWQRDQWWLFTLREDGTGRPPVALGADGTTAGDATLTCKRCGREFRVADALRWTLSRRPKPRAAA